MTRPLWPATLALGVLVCAPAAHAQLLTPSPAADQGVTTPTPGPADASPSFATLFRQVGNDLTRLPARENLLWLGLGAGLSLLGHGADREVTAALSTSRRVEDALDAGQVLGGAPVQLGGAVAAYAVGRLTGHSALAQVGADLLRAQIVSQAVTQGVKMAAGRDRPDGTRFSFPSGHSAAAFASATVLQRRFGRKVGVPAYGLATYVAASRLSENRHYLSDVIFGAAVGMIGARTVTVGHGRATFALVPLATTRGPGIALARVSAP